MNPSVFSLYFLEIVLAAGCFSLGGLAMKHSDGLSNPGPTVLTAVLFLAGAALQALAMRGTALSVTYVVVLGFEAITAMLLGVLLLGEHWSALKGLATVLIVAGVALLR